MNTDSFVTEKNALRKNILAIRNQLTEAERGNAGDKLIEKLQSLPQYQEASNVLIYVNYREELPTLPLIHEMEMQDHKKVFVPKVLAPHEMEFYRIHHYEQELAKGYMGIPEPKDCTEGFLSSLHEGKTLMVMPGVAFDPQGNRLGYGGGFYDSYLSANRNRIDWTIAIGYACQEVEQLPVDVHDEKPDLVILV